MEETVSFASWLKARRRALDMTQAELAHLVGCTTATIKKIEQDERRPSREIAERMARALELPSAEYEAFVQSARGLRAADRLTLPSLPGEQATAPPRGLESNLPVRRTRLIGRRHELAQLQALLVRSDVALVTLTGPGGTGKTRLALQVAADVVEQFDDGVWFVDLSPIWDPELVIPTIATVLGVIETAEQPLLSNLKAHLRGRHLLLVLDNLEQVLPAGTMLAELLTSVPGLTILATSRERLHLRGEHEYEVIPLMLPDLQKLPDAAQLSQYDAVALFIQRATEVKADFQVTKANGPAIAEVCVRLDGLPLAIELAASRIKLLPPEALLARLSQRLTLLTGGPRDVPMRQQTLRNAIDWSYSLLTDAEQMILRHLGVFVGGWTLEAAEVVCSDSMPSIVVMDGLQSLLDKSLIQQLEGLEGEPRFTMLETIREYANERLVAQGEASALRRRHAEYFLQLAEAAGRALEQLTADLPWMERLEAEHDNLRAALQWALDQREASIALRLAVALKDFWGMRGYFVEGSQWLEAAVEASVDAIVDRALWARALLAMALGYQGDLRRQDALYGESLAVFQELDDRAGIAEVLGWRAMTAKMLGEYPRAIALFEEHLALERAGGNRQGIARALLGLGWIAHDLGDFERAFTLLDESLTVWRELGDQRGIGIGLYALGVAAYQQGDFARASSWLEASRLQLAAIGDKADLPMVLAHLGSSLASQGEVERATRLLDELRQQLQAAGEGGGLSLTLRFKGKAALQQGDWLRAQAALQESLRLKTGVGEQWVKWEIAACVEELAAVADGQDDAARAARLAGAAAALRDQMGAPMSPGDRSWYEPAIAHVQAMLGEAGFMAAEAEGRAMTLEQAVAYALSDEA